MPTERRTGADLGYRYRNRHSFRAVRTPFTPFERLGAEQSGIEGTGLGLAVAKRLVEEMQGTMGVESVPDEGSNFWVEFPVTESSSTAAKLGNEPRQDQPVAAGEKRSVLYIEDNISSLRLMERVFQQRPSIDLLSAHNGLEGLGLAGQRRPDLVLLDLNLPDIDGQEILHRLQSDACFVGIPVVVISADATSKQRDKLLRAGATDYLTKPLNIKRFLQVLDQSLDGTAPLEDPSNSTDSSGNE